MDPDACLRRFVEACHAGDAEEAVDAIDDLRDWIAGGGFLPRKYHLTEGADT